MSCTLSILRGARGLGLAIGAMVAFWAVGLQAADPDSLTLRGKEAPANAIWLDSIDLSHVTAGWGKAMAGRAAEGTPLRLHDATFQHGVGTHAVSEMRIDLKGAAKKFISMVGVDDETQGRGSVRFEVWADGRKIATSGLLRGGSEPELMSVDLSGAKRLKLVVTQGDDNIDKDHADWAGAMLVLDPDAKEKPVAAGLQLGKPAEIAMGTSPMPAIHGPRITGATPGRPLLFLIPATGEKPLTFSAEKLPEGLTLDETTGIIKGSLKDDGTTLVKLTVKNARGEASRELAIVGGEHKLALTPPMGWNSWNCWASAVSDEKVRASADAMVSSGLAAHGFQYINIDDCWEGKRDANGEILTNEKFPDMKALADYVHSKGLKLGIYSSPGPKTCAGFEASYKHEEQDAKTYAKWGVDYLKYDWCSYNDIAPKNPNRADLMKPYQVMHKALDSTDRDIVFSLCQYGMGDVWEWGEQVGGNCSGGQLATSTTVGTAWPASDSARMGTRSTPVLDIGTIRTCSSSAKSAGGQPCIRRI